jgi:hypothetical protein
LSAGLKQPGFIQSKHDTCLFLNKGLICVIYVDDTISAGPDASKIAEEIDGLGVSKYETQHSFQLRDEVEVGDFLGIRISKEGEGAFLLTQTGLIDKVLKTSGMEDYNRCCTPAATTPSGADTEGDAFIESWGYACVVGMLMYLAANTRPDISYAVHQVARHTHAHRGSHAVAVKRILRYLKGTKDKGLYFKPDSTDQVDCYVDADFAGMFSVGHGQAPVSLKSRTGYAIMYSGVPVFWVSKMQTQIALSTMEAEYIALSQSMRDLIPIWDISKDSKRFMLMEEGYTPKCTTHSKAFKEVEGGEDIIPPSLVYEDNEACLKFAQMPKLSPHTKHIGVHFHRFRTKIINLEISVKPIASVEQLADQFTKGLAQEGRMALMGW